MEEKFTRTSRNVAVSNLGYTVTTKGTGGLFYDEYSTAKRIEIDTEWLSGAEPGALYLYRDSPSHRKDLQGRSSEDIEVIFGRIIKALLFMRRTVHVVIGGATVAIYEPG